MMPNCVHPYEKHHSIRAVVSIGLEVKHCNMLIWKWDLGRGKTLKEEEVQQYCFQCKWFMMSCLHGEAERSRGWQQMIKGGASAKLLPKWVKHIWQSISAWQRFLALDCCCLKLKYCNAEPGKHCKYCKYCNAVLVQLESQELFVDSGQTKPEKPGKVNVWHGDYPKQSLNPSWQARISMKCETSQACSSSHKMVNFQLVKI